MRHVIPIGLTVASVFALLASDLKWEYLPEAVRLILNLLAGAAVALGALKASLRANCSLRLQRRTAIGGTILALAVYLAFTSIWVGRACRDHSVLQPSLLVAALCFLTRHVTLIALSCSFLVGATIGHIVKLRYTKPA